MHKAPGNKLRLLIEKTGDVVWTVDMNMCLTFVSPSIRHHLGYTVEEALATKMEDIFSPHSYELAMGVFAEEMASEEQQDTDPNRTRMLELDLVDKNGLIVPFEINYSLLRDSDGNPLEILAMARNIQRRKNAEVNHRVSTEKLVSALEQTIQALAMLGEMKDPFTAGHQRCVASLACTIAAKMGLPPDRVKGIRLAGLIHDIGKVRVPAEILTNPNPLSSAEFEIIKAHPTTGYGILNGIDFPWSIAEAVYEHHERLNGSGYPRGLSGKNIILEARILAVADVVEATASHRPYRPALGIDAALEEIAEQKGVLFDPVVVVACLEVFRRDGYQFDKEPPASSLGSFSIQ